MARRKRSTEEDRARLEERRRSILDAASRVFARRGYHRSGTREIAAEADVAEGTIYNYYANKRQLLLALIEKIIMEAIPRMPQELDGTDVHSLFTDYLRERLKTIDHQRDVLLAVVPELFADKTLQEEYLKQVVPAFVEHFGPIAEQTFRTAGLRLVNPRLVVPAIIGGTLAAFVFNERDDFMMGAPVPHDEVAAELVSLFLDGLLGRPNTEGPVLDEELGRGKDEAPS